MRARLLPLALLALGTTACIDTLKAPDGRLGAITAAAFENGGGYVLSPEAAFYDKNDFQYVTVTTDTCVLATYNATQTGTGTLITLNAGDRLFTQVSGRIDTLTPIPGISIRVYTPIRAQGIPYTPGDTLMVTIPGAPGGFPASAISIRTAEPFTHDPIVVPTENQSLTLTWTAAPEPGSQMTFSLRYANSFGSGGLNEQIFCSFVDDGSATISAGYLDGWRTALSGNRQTRAVRIRSREVTIDSRTRLSIISSFGQPLATLNP